MRDEPGIKQPAHSGFEFSRALDFCAIFIANPNRLLQISSYSPKDMPRHNGCFSGKFSLSGNTPPFHKVSADRFPDRRFLFSERKKIPTLNIRYKNRIKGNPEESLPLFPLIIPSGSAGGVQHTFKTILPEAQHSSEKIRQLQLFHWPTLKRMA